jgi:YcaO-like protein with predicted kinase domain
MHSASSILDTLDRLESVDLLKAINDRYSPMLTSSAMRNLMLEIGATRLASSTLLDRLGIPAYYCIRPSALDPCAIYSSGKGLSAYQASMSAIFESYERWAAERALYKETATLQELLLLARRRPLVIYSYSDMTSEPVEWAFGKNMLTQQVVAAPADMVQFPPVSARLTTTTGLAAHTASYDAIRNGYFECVERHYSANIEPGNLLRVSVADFCERCRKVDTIFRDNDIELHAFVIPSSACFIVYCFSYDHWLGVPQMHCSGFGASDSLNEALQRALLEIVQGRAAYISGLRDDVSKYIKPKSDQIDSSEQYKWLEQLRSLRHTYSHASASGAESSGTVFSETILRMSNNTGAKSPTCFPLRTAQQFPAFRIVIPELDDCT